MTNRTCSESPRSELSEAAAIALAQQGDSAAFERLYRLHSRRVYSLCLRMVANPVEAEDLTQDAFLQVFRKIGTFRGESGFSTWLHRLTVNIVLMRFRRMKRAELSLDQARESTDENTRPPIDLGEEDLHLHGLIDRVNLGRAVDRLPLGYKQMFVLHDVQGYEHNEIAAILGCTIGNSKSQLHKARSRLRQLLRESSRSRARRERESASARTAEENSSLEGRVPDESAEIHARRPPQRKSAKIGWPRPLHVEYAKT